MERIDFATIINALKKNFIWLFSLSAALCLFITPSVLSLLIISAIFIVIFRILLLGGTNWAGTNRLYIRLCAILLSLLVLHLGYDSFITTWSASSKVSAIADSFHLSRKSLLTIIGVFGCVIGFYSTYSLSVGIIKLIRNFLQKNLPEQRKEVAICNLKKNWYFPISATAFFCLHATLSLEYFIGIFISFLISLTIASQIPSIWNWAKQNSKRHQIISVPTALGICWGGQASFYADWNLSSRVQAIEKRIPIKADIPYYVSVLGTVFAFFFVYVCVLIFWDRITNIVAGTSILEKVSALEIFLYLALLLASIIFIAFSFGKTEAFYGTKYAYDIIYTSDSPSLVKGNVYLSLTHPENDLRQPLFAVFSAPFLGIPYLIGRIFNVSSSVQAMLINIAQLTLLFLANYMLAKMMKLTNAKRICFMILNCSTYTYLLFILMMEQYIIAYFWLIFCMYLICENGKLEDMILWGAGGTLLTSMVLLPFTLEETPVTNFKRWLNDMLKSGLKFVAVMILFCRFDIIYNLTSRITFLRGFTGKAVSFSNKIFQFTAFVRNCFLAPNAGVNFTAVEHISWQLKIATTIDYVGVILLILAIISAFVNKSHKSSLLAAAWAGFSVIMLLVLGWGTKENGLILYSLYFGWSFFVLLFQLIEKIEDWLKIGFLTPIVSLGCTTILAIINIPAIFEMVNFSITYFPA